MHESRGRMKTGRPLLSIVEFVVLITSPAQSTGYTPFFLEFWLSPVYSESISSEKQMIATIETVKPFSL